MKRRVVITGLGIISGIGKNIMEAWENIENCRSGIGPIIGLDTSPVRFKKGCEVKDYSASDHFSKKEIDLMDKFTQFTLLSAREAVNNSGIEWTDAIRNRTCVITGTGIGGQDSQDNAFFGLYKEGKNSVPLFTIPRIMPNAGASQITMEFGITGFAFTISTACSSSNHAIGNAFWMIQNGICDYAITGGSETPFSLAFLKGWEALRVIDPETCRPFSKGRKGMIIGEGAATLVLESLESAKKRNATIYAELVGFGMSSDASHVTKPNGTGAQAAIRMALENANVNTDQIGYINAHGTGTQVNDSMEASAIQAVFGNHTKHLPVSSTKSLHGHILGGTGAIEAVITSLGLKNQVLPPTANYLEADPECDLDVVPNAARNAKIEYALSNAFAFGGLNAVLVFKKWE